MFAVSPKRSSQEFDERQQQMGKSARAVQGELERVGLVANANTQDEWSSNRHEELGVDEAVIHNRHGCLRHRIGVQMGTGDNLRLLDTGRMRRINKY
jgi:hypothetical protein